MKLLYATSISYPSRLANRIQTIEMARQFDRLTNGFILGGHSINGVDGIRNVENFRGSRRSYILGLRYALFIKKQGVTHVFSREENLIFFILFYGWFIGIRPKIIFEAHSLPEEERFLWKRTIDKVDKIIVLTRLAKYDLVDRGVPEDRIIVAPDAVDPSLFRMPLSREDAREKLILPLDKKIILYTGHLYQWKGVQVLADASKRFPSDWHAYFVGGTDKDIISFKDKNSDNINMTIVGHVPHGDIPTWLWAADVLVLPNSSKEKISSRYTSPLKLFEYMMSDRPIVVSDMPSTREVLDDSNAVFFKADNTDDLYRAISDSISDFNSAVARARKAFEKVQGYTWEKRAGNLLDLLQ